MCVCVWGGGGVRGHNVKMSFEGFQDGHHGGHLGTLERNDF